MPLRHQLSRVLGPEPEFPCITGCSAHAGRHCTGNTHGPELDPIRAAGGTGWLQNPGPQESQNSEGGPPTLPPPAGPNSPLSPLPYRVPRPKFLLRNHPLAPSSHRPVGKGQLLPHFLDDETETQRILECAHGLTSTEGQAASFAHFP